MYICICMYVCMCLYVYFFLRTHAVTLERKGLKIMRRMLMKCAWKCLLTWQEHSLLENHHRVVQYDAACYSVLQCVTIC